MDLSSFYNLFSSFGLSSAAGLNAYIPLLAIGLMNRYNVVTLQEPFAILGSTVVLTILFVLAVIDFVADKVPAIDHVTHIIGGLVHPVAGAVAFASQNNMFTNIHPAVALGAGFIMAGGFHATRAAVRPVATATTGGMANPVVSFAEDVLSLIMSVLAIFLPLIAFVLFLVLLFLVIRSWRSVRRRMVGFRR